MAEPLAKTIISQAMEESNNSVVNASLFMSSISIYFDRKENPRQIFFYHPTNFSLLVLLDWKYLIFLLLKIVCILQ